MVCEPNLDQPHSIPVTSSIPALATLSHVERSKGEGVGKGKPQARHITHSWQTASGLEEAQEERMEGSKQSYGKNQDCA